MKIHVTKPGLDKPGRTRYGRIARGGVGLLLRQIAPSAAWEAAASEAILYTQSDFAMGHGSGALSSCATPARGYLFERSGFIRICSDTSSSPI